MSALDRVLEYYRGLPGVVRAEPMDREISEKVLDIELNTRTQADGEYENLGYKMVMKKDHRVCVFYTEDFNVRHSTELYYVDDNDHIMGQMLTDAEIEEFRNRDDIIWVSNDFVMFPDQVGEGEGRFVLYPFECCETDTAAGCTGCIGASPVLPADTLMKHTWNVPDNERIFSMVLGFDE